MFLFLLLFFFFVCPTATSFPKCRNSEEAKSPFGMGVIEGVSAVNAVVKGCIQCFGVWHGSTARNSN